MDYGEWFDWDEGNEGHVARHGVEPFEVEEALLDPLRIGADAYRVPGEVRRGAIGATIAGRVLRIVYAIRNGKIRPITAHDANNAQKRRYRRR